MHTAPARRWDICAAVIPRGVPYRIGHTTPDAVDDAFADDEPAARVTATTTPEGLVRVEVYQACAACPVTNATPGKEIAHELINDGCAVELQ